MKMLVGTFMRVDRGCFNSFGDILESVESGRGAAERSGTGEHGLPLGVGESRLGLQPFGQESRTQERW